MDKLSFRKGYKIKKISIVVPAKDEEENLGSVLDETKEALKNIDKDFEIIVIDDHSKDRTAQIALEKGVKVVANPGRPGKGNALRLGFKESAGDVIIMFDADCSHRPKDISLFLEGIERGAGLVIGSRIWGGSDEYTKVRATGNFFFTAIFGLIFDEYLSDVLNGYKAFRREIFDNYKYNSSDFEIEIELAVNTLRCGYKILEVPSHERMRVAGKMKSSVIRHGTKFLLKVLCEAFKFHILKDKGSFEKSRSQYPYADKTSGE